MRSIWSRNERGVWFIHVGERWVDDMLYFVVVGYLLMGWRVWNGRYDEGVVYYMLAWVTGSTEGGELLLRNNRIARAIT